MAFRGSLQDIRLFVAAYEENSFTAAAVRGCSTQSGVSHHIRRLESLLDVTLFIREKATLTKTPAADAFYRHCVELLRSIDRASDAVERFSKGYQGQFRVGIMPALTHRTVAPVLLRFSQRNPNVKVRVLESYSESLPALVAAGEIDFAIGSVHGAESGVRVRTLLSSPECLIARSNGAGPADVYQRLQLAPANIVWAARMASRRNSIEAWLSAHDLPVGGALEVESPLVTLDMVSRSDWVTVAPALIIDPVADAARFTAVPLRDPQISISVTLVQPMSAELSPEAAEFVDMLVAEAKRANQAWEEQFKGLLPWPKKSD